MFYCKKKASHERKKTVFTMPVNEFDVHNPNAHDAYYGFEGADGINP
jgi:hypothetical protein